MDPNDFSPFEQTIEGMDELPVNPFPFPQKYGGSGIDNDLSKKGESEVFDIRNTSAAEAQKIYEDHQQQQVTDQPQDMGDDGFGQDNDYNQNDGKPILLMYLIKLCLNNFY